MAMIRSATPDDAASIARVHVESWQTTYRGVVPDGFLDGLDVAERTAMWRSVLRPEVRALVAERDGEVIGFACGAAIREPLGEYDAELGAIYLLLKAQREGLGTRLLRELARGLDGDGFRSMMAWVLQANTSSVFYERSGAVWAAEKQIEVGGVLLPAVAYGWPSLKAIVALHSDSERG